MRALNTPVELLVLDLDERPWAAYAACRDADPDQFFSSAESDVAAAVKICRGCPVLEECLEWALETRVRYGIWGATTERERRRMARRSA